MLRTILFILVSFLAFSAPFALFVFGAVWYRFAYIGYELFLVSVLADAYYLQAGNLSLLPVHTLWLGAVFLLHALVSPYIVIDQKN